MNSLSAFSQTNMWPPSLTTLWKLSVVCSETGWSNSNELSWLSGQSSERASHRTIWPLLWRLTAAERKSHVRIWLMDLCLRNPNLPGKCRSECEICPPTQSFPGSGGGAVGKWEAASWLCVLILDKHLRDPAGGIPINVCATLCVYYQVTSAFMCISCVVGNDLFTGYRIVRCSSKCTGQPSEERKCDAAWETNSLTFTHNNLRGPNQHSSITPCFMGTLSAWCPISIKVTSLCRLQDGLWEWSSILLNPLLSWREAI